MNCTFCDTMYAVKGGIYNRMSIERVVEAVSKMRNEHVCITGGEPLIHTDIYPLIYELCNRGYKVNIETNGGVEIEDRAFRSFRYIMDIKTPGSGMESRNIYENIGKLKPQDELKFVIGDIEDYEFAKDTIRKYPCKAHIIFSPVFVGDNTEALDNLKTWIHEDKLRGVRLGMQLHKIMGVS